ncbi:hypothetical protein [Ollibium composti]|uniref:Uncharacterized protein n=1 Tax=Ollibium composti TaxID=2675109 RepID=A0ABY2Q4E2_9HYPH|nr:hypothetical protein [Mesorhizobium composti]THF54832.1 hypothetical protein E6C48_20385 [Mesorhizobium composti]
MVAISVVAKAGSVLSLPGPVICVAAIVAGVAIGAAVHEILEKPIAAFLKNRPDRRTSAHSVA